VARAGFNHSAMIVCGGVNQRGLRVRLSQHVVEPGVVELGIETELLRVPCEECLAGIGDADDLDVGAVKILLEEPLDVSVNQADDSDAQGRGSGLGGCRCGEENDREQRG